MPRYEQWTNNRSNLTIDTITGAMNITEYEHHEIHAGSMFHAYYAVTTAATDAHRSGIYIKTPASGGKLCHLVAYFSCSSAANASICEAPTIASNTGTVHTNVPSNRYRDSTRTSGVFSNATTPLVNRYTTLAEAAFAGDGTWAKGTVLQEYPLETGTGPKPAGGTTRGAEEWILKAGTAYVFLLTNTAATANNHLIELDWYEHTNIT